MRQYLMILVIGCVVSTAAAATKGQYSIDADTLHLYHFNGDAQDAPGTINLTLNGATVTGTSAAGFRTAMDTYDGVAGGTRSAGGSANPYAISNFTGSDGAFTFEAIVRPDITLEALKALGSANHMQIICGEGDSTTTRGWHFRINNSGQLQFTKLAGTVEDIFKPAIPTTGDHAYAVGAWYHAAVTYNGAENTAGNLKLYWTRLDSGVTEAQLLGSFQMAADLTSTVLTRFCIGNELRGPSAENFEGLIDEVRISRAARTADEMIVGTLGATHPSPAHGAINVDPVTTTLLRWTMSSAANISKQYLYMVESSDPNFLGAAPVTVTDLLDPIEADIFLSLKTDKVYYWRVDTSIRDSSATDPNTITGAVWRFETAKSVPVITVDPAGTAAFPAETAEFSAMFISRTTPTVSWFRKGAPDVLLVSGGDITVTVTGHGDGVYSSTLSINNVEVADEGYYSCSVTNGSLATDESLSAGLAVNRLIAYYPFDGDAMDAAGTVDGTLKKADPNAALPAFITGVPTLGQAIEFYGDQYVELSAGACPHSGAGGGLEAGTIACWVRIDAFASSAAMVMGTHNSGTGPAFQMWFDEANGQRINCRLRQNSGDSGMPHANGTTAASLVGDGQWHLIAATYEIGDVGQLYLDGKPFGVSDTYISNPAFNPWDFPMLIGANSNRGTVADFLNGAIDDVRIYNYRLSGTQIADMYLAAYPDAVLCLNPYANEFDYDGDCIVGLSDFARIVENWLTCGRYPAANCN